LFSSGYSFTLLLAFPQFVAHVAQTTTAEAQSPARPCLLGLAGTRCLPPTADRSDLLCLRLNAPSNMRTASKRLLAALSRLWRRFKLQWSEPVPEDIAVCEFDCRKSQCSYGEWASCDRRISGAAGELMPPRPPVSSRQKS